MCKLVDVHTSSIIQPWLSWPCLHITSKLIVRKGMYKSKSSNLKMGCYLYQDATLKLQRQLSGTAFIYGLSTLTMYTHERLIAPSEENTKSVSRNTAKHTHNPWTVHTHYAYTQRAIDRNFREEHKRCVEKYYETYPQEVIKRPFQDAHPHTNIHVVPILLCC